MGGGLGQARFKPAYGLGIVVTFVWAQMRIWAWLLPNGKEGVCLDKGSSLQPLAYLCGCNKTCFLSAPPQTMLLFNLGVCVWV